MLITIIGVATVVLVVCIIILQVSTARMAQEIISLDYKTMVEANNGIQKRG